jgi:retinol dehydrogenase-12
VPSSIFELKKNRYFLHKLDSSSHLANPTSSFANFIMSLEFPIEIEKLLVLRTFFHSQFFGTPAVPEQSFAGQVIIVTGANVGLGLEAARHFYRLNCAKLILAVRNVSKGEAAKEDIVESVKHRTDADAIEIWPLDLTSTDSTTTFASRVLKTLPRLDAVVENAGVVNNYYYASESYEQTLQVNVLNTFLLALLLLPRLKETKSKFADSSPHLVIVSSDAYRLTRFRALNEPDFYKALNDEKSYDAMNQ